MKLKLTLFILGLTLCASWPTFRNLAENNEENNEEHCLIDGELGEYVSYDGDNEPNIADLLDLTFHNNEENVELSLGEENNEGLFPTPPSDDEPEGNNEQPTTPEEPTPVDNTTTPTNNTTPTEPVNPWTALTQDEIQNNAQVQAVLNYGGNETIQNGFNKKKIPVSIYSITKVISVGTQALSRGRTAYNCSVEIEDPRGILVKAQYVVNVRDSTKAMTVKSWSWQIFNLRYADDPFPTTNTTNNNTNTNNTNTNTTQPTNPDNNGNNSTNTTEPTTNTTTPTNTTNTTSPDGYIELDASEIQASAEIQGALNYGANQIILSGNAKDKIPVSNYSISQVNSVERKAQSNGRNAYRCDVEITGVNKAVIQAQYVVYVKVATQEYSIGAWTYNISIPRNNNNNNNTTVNYTALTPAEIAGAEVQGALNYGVNQTLQYGYTKARIPVSSYSINKVVSVGKQVLSNGRNSYQCSVELKDAKGVEVKAQFVVNVKVATQEMSMGSWAYQVYNLRNGKNL